jgi:N-acetylmuramoyl-L-alanine amidase-like protein
MTVIDESLTAKGFTPRNSVPLVYGMPRTIEAITIHWWGAYGQTHSGVNNFFVNGPGNTSAHFVASGVPTKRINCLVNPWDAAWHAGNAVGNATTIGIECRPEATDADYEVVAELVRFLRDTYGPNLPLIPHRHWQSTACPGNYDLARIHRMAEALKTPVVKPASISPKPSTGGIVDIGHERQVFAKTPVNLVANTQVALKNGASNWNLAVEGLGYYDCDVFIQGTGLEDGEVLTVQAFIVTAGGRSGYFTQEIPGTTTGKFQGSVRLKTPLLSTAKLEIEVKASTNAVITVYGADTYAFKK